MRNQFSTWVQDDYSHRTDQQLDPIITQGKKVMLGYWHRWQQSSESMIAQDQGICKQATILPHIAYMHTCTFSTVCVKMPVHSVIPQNCCTTLSIL